MFEPLWENNDRTKILDKIAKLEALKQAGLIQEYGNMSVEMKDLSVAEDGVLCGNMHFNFSMVPVVTPKYIEVTGFIVK